MSLDENKRVARLYIEEAIGKGDPSIVANYCAPNATSFHTRYKETSSAEEGRAQGEKTLRTGLPDFVVVLNELVAEGDTVVAYWRFSGTHLGEVWGVAATGRPVVVDNISTFKFQDGKILRSETVSDRMSVAVQIGSVGDYAPMIEAGLEARLTA
jgi:predicted ester cyclase